jgi:hypothetical protein
MPFYRFTKACREVILNYLKVELEDGTKHFDGSSYVELPSPVTIIDAYPYDPRKLPVVITDVVTGQSQNISFNQEMTSYIDTAGIYGDRGGTYQTFGGRGNFDVNIICAANDRITMELLTDIVGFTLLLGRGWIYYNRHILLGEVRFAGDGIDDKIRPEPVYYGNISIPATADWRLIVPKDTVTKINPDFDLVTPDDPFDDPRNAVPGIITPLDPPLMKDIDSKVQKPKIEKEFLQPMRSTPGRRNS